MFYIELTAFYRIFILLLPNLQLFQECELSPEQWGKYGHRGTGTHSGIGGHMKLTPLNNMFLVI